MGFFFFIIVGGIVFWLVHQRRKNVQNEWSQAASRLGLNYSGGGLLNPQWIYGKKAGLRYDIKTFNRTAKGAAHQKWTGYRVRFHRSADMRIRVTEAARNRLTNRFSECEIDDEGIFCARVGIETDAPAIIDNVERLQSVTARLLAAAEEEEIEASRASPPPPPAPADSTEPAPEISKEDHEEPISVAVAEPLEESSPGDFESVFEIAAEEAAQSAGDDIGEPEHVEAIVPTPSRSVGRPSEIGAEANADPETIDGTSPAPDSEPPMSLMTLAKVSGDLFDSGRNHFQITQRFDAEYNGLAMLGEGKLVRAEPYSNDRTFGRGPGTLAEVEIHRPEEPLPGHNTIRAVVQLPEDASARSLRGNLGDTVTISGTMLRCDAFEGRIFLGAGELAS